MSHRERASVPGGVTDASAQRAELDVEQEALEAEDTAPSGVVLRREVLKKVPRLAVSMVELRAMPIDHRAGFVISFVDGTYSIETILDACALRREEALAILGELAARGIIVLD